MRYAGWWLQRETLTLLWFNRGKVWWARLDRATPALGILAGGVPGEPQAGKTGACRMTHPHPDGRTKERA